MISDVVPLRGISQSETKHISPGARRHIRREKARIRREYIAIDEIKKHIAKLYETFGANSGAGGVDTSSPDGIKEHSPRKGRDQDK